MSSIEITRYRLIAVTLDLARLESEFDCCLNSVISGTTGTAGGIALRKLGETSFRVPANTKLKLVLPLHNDGR